MKSSCAWSECDSRWKCITQLQNKLEKVRLCTVFMLFLGGEPPQLPDRGARPHALCACAGPSSAEDDRAGRPGVLHLRRRKSSGERADKDARRPGHFGGVFMRWPMINPKVIELQILAEVFHARLGEVEEMIQMRLEERSWD
jgi:hypothetical protein